MTALTYPKEYALSLNGSLRDYKLCRSKWSNLKTAFVVRGATGCGKTTFVLQHFKDKDYFYFSFKGLCEEAAEALFAKQVSEKLGIDLFGWEGSITAVSKRFKYILFDDLASISSYKRFQKAFYDYLITDINNRPFVVLIAHTTDSIDELIDTYATLNIDYLTARNVAKIFPNTPKPDVLGVSTLSGGIPKIVHEYDRAKTFEDNLRNMLRPMSAFYDYMPVLLARCFRKPENYHYILCAIANGNHNVSEIGKFTNFAYNKCDNYLSGLIENDFVYADKITSKRGATKTAYKLSNNYFRLWHLYIYGNHTELQQSNEVIINEIVQNIINKEIHRYHLEIAMKYVNEKIRGSDMKVSFYINERITHTPRTVSKGNFRYTFDAVARNGNKAVFVKVLEYPGDGCSKETLESIRKAVALLNEYYDSRVFIFSKRRVSDYAVKEASDDDVLNLVRVEQLR